MKTGPEKGSEFTQKKLICKATTLAGIFLLLLLLVLTYLISCPAFAASPSNLEPASVEKTNTNVDSAPAPEMPAEKSALKEPGASETDAKENKSTEPVFSLDDCIKKAFEIHPELKAALANRQAVQAQLTQTRSVYYPQISYSNTYNRSFARLSTGNSEADSYGSSLSLNQKIYDFGRTMYSVMAARENLRSSGYDVLQTADQIILDIRENYYKAVAAGKVLVVMEDSFKQQELHLKQARGFYQVGRRSKIEVTKAEVDLANAKLDLIKAQNAVKLTRVKLANAIGLTGPFNYALDDDVRFVEIKMDLERALQYAGLHRPEILKINSQEKMYNARVNQARAEWYPTISGQASYGYNDDHFIFVQNAWSWGLTLNFDVFTGGYRPAYIKESKENLKSLQAQKERLWQDIALEVQQYYIDLEEARQSIVVLEKSLEQARENFSLAQARYEVGLGDNLEFTDARVAFQQSQNDLISAILDYQIARSQLEKSVGMSVSRPEFIDKLKEDLSGKND